MVDTQVIMDDDSNSFNAEPSRYPFLKDLRLDLDVTRRLTLHLDRLRVGDSTVITSALGKSHDPYTVLEKWDEIFNSKLSLMNSPLLELEKGNRDKYGPRSICKKWSDRISSIENYYSNKAVRLPYDIYSGLKYNGSRGRLRPLSVDAALKHLKNNTNSGLPFYKEKGLIKSRLKSKLEYLLSRRDPCILFTRTQEGNKTRDVWGYPCADTLEEMRFYRPLLEHQSKLTWRSALLGPDYVSKCVTDLLLRASSDGLVVLSGDMSKFDASVIHELIRASFYYIKLLFQSEYSASLDRICDRFSNIGIITPDGIASGLHGVPSGSTFTNEVDSIVHYLVLSSLGFSSSDFQIQGDDFLLLCKGDSIDRVKSRYKESSLDLNDKGSLASDYCIYLQNLYHKDYIKNGIIGGIYPTYRALCRIMFQERWSGFEEFDLGGIDYYSIRTISILENCKHHPLFYDLVKFVHSLDKYSLRFSKDSVNKYNAYLNNGSGQESFLNNQYGDNIKGIYSFETVKIINGLNKR